MDTEHIKYLKDEINEVLDHVISDIMKTNKEDAPAFKVGDIVRRIGSNPAMVGVVTHVFGSIIYVMWPDGSCCDEERVDWYKVGHITWFGLFMYDLKNVLEEY